MEFVIIIALLLVGLILFGVEVFVAPGISVAGIGAAVSLLSAVGYAFSVLGMEIGLTTLFVAVAGVVGMTIWFMKSKTMDRLSLKQTLDYRDDPLKEAELHTGEEGVTVTRLALIGNVNFNGRILEAQSAAGFIEENTAVRIVRVDSRGVFVEPLHTTE